MFSVHKKIVNFHIIEGAVEKGDKRQLYNPVKNSFKGRSKLKIDAAMGALRMHVFQLERTLWFYTSCLVSSKSDKKLVQTHFSSKFLYILYTKK